MRKGTHMKNLKMILSLYTAFALLTNAHATGGVSGSGGGNSINHRLVEEYVVEMEKTEGYDLFEQKLKELEKELPVFGKTVREKFESLTFYSIPRKMKELPKEKTGLDFESEQMAIHSGQEVFIDEEIFAKLSPKGKAMFFMHEAVMAMLEDKKSPGVRKVVTQIFAPKGGIKRLQSVLREQELGSYFTAGQHGLFVNHMRSRYGEAIRHNLALVKKECEAENGPVSKKKFDAALDLMRVAGRLTYYREGTTFSSPSIQMPFDTFHSNYGNNAIANLFQPWPSHCAESQCANRRTSYLQSFCQKRPDSFEFPMCGSFFLHLHCLDDKPGCTPKAKVDAANNTLEMLNNEESKDRTAIFLRISGSPAFVNISALLRDETNKLLDRKAPEVTKPDIKDEYSEHSTAKAVIAVTKKVDARTPEVAALSLEEKYNLLCQSAGSVLTDVEKGMEADWKLERPKNRETTDPARDNDTSDAI